MLRSGWVRSLITHALIVGAIAYHLSHEAPGVKGSAGLSGRTQTHFDMTVSAPKEVPVEKVKALPIREGLPTDVKNPKPREIEAPAPAAPEKLESAGESESAPAGTPGQAGTGTTPAANLGNADRTNSEGIYLLKLQQRIQENLEGAGYIDFDRRTLVQFIVRKNGLLEKIQIIESSGDPALDRKAIDAVKKVRAFLERATDLPVKVPVLFRATR